MENRIYAEKNDLWYARGLFIAEHHSTSRRRKKADWLVRAKTRKALKGTS